MPVGVATSLCPSNGFKGSLKAWQQPPCPLGLTVVDDRYIGLISMKHVGSEPTTSLCLVVKGLGFFLPRLEESVLRREDICILRLHPVAC